MQDFIDGCIREMARKAIAEQKGFAYMLFWMRESSAWQERAKRIFQEELKKSGKESV